MLNFVEFFDFFFFATTIPLVQYPSIAENACNFTSSAVEGADLIIIITVNNAVSKTKDGRIIHCPPSPNRNLDIWSQFLSGEFDSA